MQQQRGRGRGGRADGRSESSGTGGGQRGRGRSGGRDGGRGRSCGGEEEHRRECATVEAIYEPSASASVPQIPPMDETEIQSTRGDMQRQMHIEPATAVVAAPSSSKCIRPPSRPGFGTMGTKVVLGTMHFPVQVSLTEIFPYDVAITPKVHSKAVNMSVIQELLKRYRNSHLNGLLPVYDRSKNLYTARALPFTVKTFEVELEAIGRNATKFKVVIKLVGNADVTHLQQFLRGRVVDDPQEAIHALDVVLRQTPLLNYVPVSRSFFSPSFEGRGPAGNGIEYCTGYYSSLRPTLMGLSLNIDISATSFFEPILVSAFVQDYLDLRDLSGPLSDGDRIRIKRALRGAEVQVTHRGKEAERYRIKGISAVPANKLRGLSL